MAETDVDVVYRAGFLIMAYCVCKNQYAVIQQAIIF